MRGAQIFLAAAATATAMSAAAADFNRGIGTWACSKFVQSVAHSDVQVAAYSWAMGFIAGINTAAVVDRQIYFDLAGVDDKRVLGSLIAFCAAKPNVALAAAVDQFLATLPKRQWAGD